MSGRVKALHNEPAAGNAQPHTLGASHCDIAIRAGAVHSSPQSHMQASELDSLYKQALERQRLHDYEGAKALLLRLLEACPNHPDVLFRLGGIAYEKKEFTEAMGWLEKAVAQRPDSVDFQLLLASTYLPLGKYDEAERIFLRYVDLPDSDKNAAFAAFNLISMYLETLRPEKARPLCERSVERFKQDRQFVMMTGHAYLALKEYDAAIKTFDSLMDCDELRNRALIAESRAFRQKRDFSGYLRRVEPEIARTGDANLSLLAAEFCNGMGRLEDEIRLQWKVIEKYHDQPLWHSYQLKKLTASDLVDEQRIYDFSKEWDEKFGTPTDAEPFSTYLNGPTAGRRLRVGILSKTFRRHVTLTILRPLLPGLAKYFDLYGYYDDLLNDEFTDEVKHHFKAWRVTAEMSEADAAKCIHDDALDVLIDISGHFNGARTRILTYRPAPVQIHYADSSSSLGIKAVGYRFSDAIAEPPERKDPFSTEKVLRLPHGFFLYQPLYESDEPGACPQDRNGYVTFGSCASLHKITPTTLRFWKLALEAVPGSRFLLARDEFAADPGARDYWMQRFVESGIPAERVSIVSGTKDDFVRLRPYNDIDICLDTFPYSGVTTTLDALWMGVPMVNYRETRFINRVCSSLLTQVGLPDLFAESEAAYREIVVKLAADVERRRMLRRELRGMMRKSPLCDGAGMARDMAEAINGVVGV